MLGGGHVDYKIFQKCKKTFHPNSLDFNYVCKMQYITFTYIYNLQTPSAYLYCVEILAKICCCQWQE